MVKMCNFHLGKYFAMVCFFVYVNGLDYNAVIVQSFA